MTKLSILLCAHCPNVGYDDLLVKAISSIYEQSYKDYKLYIVLDECWGGTLSKVNDVITPGTEIIIRNKNLRFFQIYDQRKKNVFFIKNTNMIRMV